MINICKRFAKKIEKDFDSLLFLYEENQVNFEHSFNSLSNSIDKTEINEIKISVYSNDIISFNCPECGKNIEIKNVDTINIKLSNDKIKNAINEIKSKIENLLKDSNIKSINNSLNDLNKLIFNINEEIAKSNKNTLNFLNNKNKYNYTNTTLKENEANDKLNEKYNKIVTHKKILMMLTSQMIKNYMKILNQNIY